MNSLRRWWRDRQFKARTAEAFGFRTHQRRGEDFGAWMSRETALWVKEGR